MTKFISTLIASGILLFSGTTLAADPSIPPSVAMIDKSFIEKVQAWANSNVVHLTLAERNRKNTSLDQAKIDALDKQWRAERKVDDQPLITAVLSSPLSGYLTRIQARSLGLYSEIFVMDAKGLNAGQSAITSDYWQGDEAKFQKTFPVGPDAVFIDEPEFNKDTGTWRAQLNMTLAKDGAAAGSLTVEINLTELERRRTLNLAQY
jgi:hypothetical protein